MKQCPNIAAAEWEVMKVVWKEGNVTAQEICNQLAPRKNWNPKTVKTLINRLLRKGALGFEKMGKAYRYRPLVDEKDCAMVESESFLDRVFGGSLSPMVAHFIENDKLSVREIRELRHVLEQHTR